MEADAVRSLSTKGASAAALGRAAATIALKEQVQCPPELSADEVSTIVEEFAARNQLNSAEAVGPDECIALKRELYSNARDRAVSAGPPDVVLQVDTTEKDDVWKETRELKACCRSCCTRRFWRTHGKKIIMWFLCFPCKSVIKCLS